ncbi:alpha/beta-hydrolase [Macroventuria anomochaeta]|uniref:Alpha/beta-hydrolase n=1 Tax=Macroventuria anomochaeta TaxID=301207 RepID=A0ACB6RWY0_9PLEO|nr:alpha/beta-hydrolase [Macroventuria anomochaeta]KAF2626283.1 alpha/beta-hydrolase [Macroventuria anomochaeta]
MQTIQEDIDAIIPYSMHVSSRYLDLTKQKLGLTRLPKEIETLSQEEQWTLGAPKSVLEPLLDHWLETYDWRGSESAFNTTLPQFRTLIPLPPGRDGNDKKPIRTHFVHARSPHHTAIPLLYCHSWPGSFIEVQRIIDLLTHPKEEGELTFHLVCPSIPGFGFSDASEDPDFGVHGAAEVFAGLMRRLGYEKYAVCGGGWGFDVARALAVRESERVLGVFTWNPVFCAPTVRGKPWEWVKWHLARLTGARWASLSFGYVPSEVDLPAVQGRGTVGGWPLGPVMHQLFSMRPQTLAFSLCDSPVGLLAVLLDLVATQGPGPLLSIRPRSPFLDPGELEMQDREYEAAGHERLHAAILYFLSMLTSSRMWLPGAEAGLRWLRRAHIEALATSWDDYCSVPLGISSFRTHATTTPLMWGAASWPVAWVRRHQETAEMPGWEAPRQLTDDLRECFGRLLDGRLETKSSEMMV